MSAFSHVATENFHTAVLDALGTRHEAQQRRLAHAIGSDQPGKTTGRDVERDVIEGDNVAISMITRSRG